MTKQETTYLKGWAVLFMMFLHFGCDFVMPEYRYSWCGNDYAGAFQICVPIFLFLSGYGLMAGSMNKGFAVFDSFKKQVKRCFKLLKHYWIVITPFVALALWMGKFAWSWESLILTATSLRCVWCPNAWFISLYIELILLFPFFFWIINRRNVKWNICFLLFLIVVTKLLGKVGWIDAEGGILSRQVKMFLIDMPIFVEGMLFAKYAIMQKILAKFKNVNPGFNQIWGGISVVLAFVCRAKLPLISVTELIHVPLCLFGLLLLASSLSQMYKAISYVGKYSTTLWLIHGYFCWTFLQPVIYSIRIWPLAYVVFVLISLAFSIVIDKVRTLKMSFL